MGQNKKKMCNNWTPHLSIVELHHFERVMKYETGKKSIDSFHTQNFVIVLLHVIKSEQKPLTLFKAASKSSNNFHQIRIEIIGAIPRNDPKRHFTVFIKLEYKSAVYNIVNHMLVLTQVVIKNAQCIISLITPRRSTFGFLCYSFCYSPSTSEQSNKIINVFINMRAHLYKR